MQLVLARDAQRGFDVTAAIRNHHQRQLPTQHRLQRFEIRRAGAEILDLATAVIGAPGGILACVVEDASHVVPVDLSPHLVAQLRWHGAGKVEDGPRH